MSNRVDAARQLCAFLPYMDENGLLPREVNNRIRMYEAETPYFGVVLAARPDVLGKIRAEQFEALSRALGWWQRERRCPGIEKVAADAIK